MKDFEKMKQQITLMENSVVRINSEAAREGRGLNKAEGELVSEMKNQISALRDKLPEPALTLQNFGGSRTNFSTPNSNFSSNYKSFSGGPFSSFGEQMVAVMRAGNPSGQVDQRLHQIMNAATGLNETVSADGGFLLQSDFSTQLLTAAIDQTDIAKLCTKIEISNNSNSIKLPAIDETSRATGSRWGGCRSYWLAEADEKQASKPKFRQIELNLKKNVVLVYCTDEMLQDSSVLSQVIGTVAQKEISFTLDDAIINGTGAGMPLGILNAGCLVSVPKEAGQLAATVVAENVVKMYSRMLSGGYRNAVWLVNSAIFPQLFTMSLSVGTVVCPFLRLLGG